MKKSATWIRAGLVLLIGVSVFAWRYGNYNGFPTTYCLGGTEQPFWNGTDWSGLRCDGVEVLPNLLAVSIAPAVIVVGALLFWWSSRSATSSRLQ